MKQFLLFICLITGLLARAETPEAILNYFKKKDVKHIVACADYPFRIDMGSNVDTRTIANAKTLESRLSYLFRHNYFDDLLNGKLKRSGDLQLLIESRTYSKDGEMESESALIFQFRKTAGGYKLYSLSVAG